MPTRPVVAALAAALAAALVAGCSPTPAALSPDEIVAAFIAESQDAARTYHTEWQGTMHSTMTVSGAPIDSNSSMSASFDFSGDDFAGTTTTTLSGTGGGSDAPSTIAYARVGGAHFIRFPDTGWQRSDGLNLPQPSFDALGGMTAADVQYEAPETVDGRNLHRLRVLDPTAALTRTLMSGTGDAAHLVADSAEYLLYVDGRGVPVRGHLSFDGQVVGGTSRDGTDLELGYNLAFDYQFTAWDEEVFIRSPM